VSAALAEGAGEGIAPLTVVELRETIRRMQRLGMHVLAGALLDLDTRAQMTYAARRLNRLDLTTVDSGVARRMFLEAIDDGEDDDEPDLAGVEDCGGGQPHPIVSAPSEQAGR
jgi:hypothetical protein